MVPTTSQDLATVVQLQRSESLTDLSRTQVNGRIIDAASEIKQVARQYQFKVRPPPIRAHLCSFIADGLVRALWMPGA